MGNKASHEKPNVVVSLRHGLCRLDTLKVSYRSDGCLRRRREIAKFTFPRTGWQCAEGIEACEAEGALSVPLARLRKKDGSRTVQLHCSSGKKTLIRTSMTLGRFLDNLNFLHFSMFCDGGDPGGAYTSMRCNGRRCGEAARPAMCPQVRVGRAAPGLVTPARADGGQGVSDLTPASTTRADGGQGVNDLTPASTARADGGQGVNDLTPASTARADGGQAASDLTPASTARADGGQAASDLTPASSDQTNNDKDGSAPSPASTGHTSAVTPARSDKAYGVGEVGAVMTPAYNHEEHAAREPSEATPDHTNQTLRRRVRRSRAARSTKRHAQGRDAPYTWEDVFIDVTAICAIVVSSVLVYHMWW